MGVTIVKFSTAFDGKMHQPLPFRDPSTGTVILDVGDCEPESVVAWELDLKDQTAGSEIMSNGMADMMGVPRDAYGRYNQVAYRIAYGLGYLIYHCTRVKQGKVETSGEDGDCVARAVIEAIPDVVRQRAVNEAKPGLDFSKVLKKKKPDATPA